MKLVVVGNGMVGQRLLEQLQAGSTAPLDVTVLCEEPRAAYDRVHLTAFFSGRTAQDLSLVEPGFFAKTGFRLHLAEAAARIDRTARQVHSAGQGARLRAPGAGDGLVRLRPADPGARPAGMLRVSHHRGP